MSKSVRNIIAVLLIAIISMAIGSGFYLYLMFAIRDAVVASAIGFCVLVALYNIYSLQRHFNRAEQHLRSAHQFERTMAARIKQLEINPPGPGIKTDAQNLPAGGVPVVPKAGISQPAATPGLLSGIAQSRGSRARGGIAAINDNSGQQEATQDNIITLNSHLERVDKPTDVKPFSIKPSQLTRALEKGALELFLQPVLALPSRDVRYFEAFVRLRVGDNILTARQFLPAAKNSRQIAEIDMLSLALTFKVIRSLQRQDNEYPLFWNIAPQTLGSKKIFKDILEQLRANQPLNRQLICEISHLAYTKLTTVQSDNLARMRDLGFELSLDRVSSTSAKFQSIDRIIEGGLFAVMKVPATELMRIVGGDITSFADHIVPLAQANNTILIAGEVESDAQTVSMIDADIYLAQGDALMPARALKKELGNG